jgi:hypothetical protein
MDAAEEIYVTVATGRPEEPYLRLTPQQVCDTFFAHVWEVKAENRQLKELLESMMTTVERMQKEFNQIATELRSTTKTAKLIMQFPKPPKTGPGEVN